MRYTISDMAAKLVTDDDLVRGLVKYLVREGFAEVMGERRPANGRGRAETVYQFKPEYEEMLASRLRAANLTGS